MNETRLIAADGEEWDLLNDAYLTASLNWLRLRLARLAAGTAVTTGTALAPMGGSAQRAGGVLLPASTPKQGRGWFFGRAPEGQVAPRSAAPATPALPRGGSRDMELERAVAAMEAAGSVDPPPALHLLAQRFGLSPFEREILLLCAGLELDTRIAGLCAEAQGDPARPFPTFALALALFDDPAWDAMTPARPLRHWRLIEIDQPGAQPLTASPLRADERVVGFLKGINQLDDRLSPFLVPFDVVSVEPLPPSQEAARVSAERALRYAGATGAAAPAVVQLVGPDSASKQLVAQRAARGLAVQLYRMPAGSLPRGASEIDTLTRLWSRECALLPLALYLDAHDGDGAPVDSGEASAGDPPLQRFLARTAGAVFLSAREVRPAFAGTTNAVEVARPTPAEQTAIWAESLAGVADADPALLAGHFDLNAFAIRGIVRAAHTESGAGSLPERIWRACLLHTAPRLDRLAQRLEPVAGWDDIVLPPDEMKLLRQLAAQVAQRTRVYDEWGFRQRMNRGLGISALFVGESGTGKTMAAEVIANHLGLHLYRIDLSAVVSKFIGETEKNLRQLFDAAEDGGVILFFDEADALFGKRTEVKDSHDRYANIEVNYLLQRIEAYRGLAILASNKRSALDDAFTRRLRFVVTFPVPGRSERREIWRRAWPPGVPVEGLNYERLSRLGLVGGSITNVALNAAFAAAERGGPVTMPLVLEAARVEYEKLERPINEAEFRWATPSGPPGADSADLRIGEGAGEAPGDEEADRAAPTRSAPEATVIRIERAASRLARADAADDRSGRSGRLGDRRVADLPPDDLRRGPAAGPRRLADPEPEAPR